jgi:diguanylate cyclase (GGDEF)-like protein
MATRPRRSAQRGRRPLTERRQLDVLYDVTRQLTTVDRTGETLALIVTEAARLLQVDAAAVRLVDGDDLVLRARTDSVVPMAAPERLAAVESPSGRTLARGEASVIEDVLGDGRREPRPTRGAASREFRAFLAVPLRAGAAVIGVLELYGRSPRRFADDDVRLAAALADQASLVLERERLVGEARDRAAHLLALARLNQLVSSSLDIDDVLGAIARAAADLMAVPAVLVWSADEPRRALTLRAFSDPRLAGDYPATEITYDDGLAGWVALHRRSVEIPDLAADPRVRPGAAAWVRAHGLVAATLTPIVFQDTVLGVLALVARGPLAHGPDARELLDGFVAQAAVAIRNARLYAQLSSAHERLQRRTRDLDILTGMSEVLQACVTEGEAYVVVARFAEQLFAEETGAVFVTGASRDLVEARAAWGGFPTAEWGVFKPEECWALRRGRPHAVDHATTAVVCDHLPRPLPAASLCVPLVAQGESLGVLHLSSRGAAAGGIGDDKQQLAQTVAEQLGLAVANLKLRETLRNQSIRDPLTGLFNRRYMEETLERELNRAERSERTLCVAMLDLDHFKVLNDSFGHEAGDLLLAEVGRLLGGGVRRGDVACRYGGEEFVLILPEAEREDALRRVDELREAARQLGVTHRGRSVGAPSFSGGLAAFPADGRTVEDLLRAADAALYVAKRAGRNRVICAGSAAGG